MTSPFSVLGSSPVSSSYMRSGSFRKSSFMSGQGQQRAQRMSAASSAVATPSYAEPALDGSAFFSGRYGSQRRTSVSSSPTVSPETFSSGGVAVRPAQAPGVVVSGFSLDGPQHAAFTGFNLSPSQLQTAPTARAVNRGTGLLARALTSEQELTSSPSASAAALEASLVNTGPQQSRGRSGAPSFWPDVDVTPLRRAQEQHAVFKNELVTMAFMVAARADQQQRRQQQQQQLDAMLAPTTHTLVSAAPQPTPLQFQQQHVSPGGMLTHCMAVAQLLADMGLDAETVAAGLLHEALRAGSTCVSQLEEFLPSSVVSLVERARTISDISGLYRGHRTSFGDEPFRRMLVAMEDVRAVLIKLADRVHVLRGAAALPPDVASALAAESLEVFSVVANRLGVWCLKAELEDLAFGILHPAEASELRAALKDRQDARALEATINTIKRSLEAHGVDYEDISGRPKNLYGVWLKLRGEAEPGSSSSGNGGSSGGSKTLDQIFDVTALRVVVANKHDCYRALRAVQEVYTTMPSRSKDFIKDIRKPNGYQSLHETVYAEGNRLMEVQIRTHKMHYIAEYGFAAHWKYKEKLDSEDQWLDKETQYKRWLTNYKLGVHDKKVRPDGSPPTDSSLKSLGVAFLGMEEPSVPMDTPAGTSKVAAAATGAGSVGASSGPALGSSIGRVDPFLKHDRFRLATAPAEQTTVQLLLQTQDTIEARDVTGGMTAAAFGATLGLGSAGIMSGYALLVNNRQPAPEALLRSGDLVQVVLASEAAARSPPRQVSSLSAAFAAHVHSSPASSATVPAVIAPSMAVTGKPPRPHSSRSSADVPAPAAARSPQPHLQQSRQEKARPPSTTMQQQQRSQVQPEGLQLFGMDLTAMPHMLGSMLGGGSSQPAVPC